MGESRSGAPAAEVAVQALRRRLRPDDRSGEELPRAPEGSRRRLDARDHHDAGLRRRHAQVAAGDGWHAGHRDRVHSRAGPRHAVHLQPGRLRDGLHVLLDRAAGIQSQSHRRGDRRSGVARESRAGRPGGDRVVTNVVFMGMGEPLANYRNVVPAAEIAMDDLGFDISRRRVTVSTSGRAADAAARRRNQLRARGLAARAERRCAISSCRSTASIRSPSCSTRAGST